MAVWAYECDFESSEGFSVGNLSGQGGWGAPSTGNDFSVTAAQAAHGTQSLTTNGITGNRGGNAKSITSVTTDGSICYVSVRADNVTSVDNFGLNFKSGASFIFTLYVGAAGANDISLREEGGGTYQILETAASANTWYRVGIEMDFTNDRVRGNIDNGAMSSWLSCPAYSSIDTLITTANNGDGATKTGFIDWISASYSAASGPANLKSLDTNVKSNIKSYNTNLLANIKSINTNV